MNAAVIKEKSRQDIVTKSLSFMNRSAFFIYDVDGKGGEIRRRVEKEEADLGWFPQMCIRLLG